MPAILDRPQTQPDAPQTSVPQGLTDAQSVQFDRDGYVVVSGLFSAAEAAEIRDAFMAQAGDGPVEGLSDTWPMTGGPDPADPLAFYPRMMNPHAQPERAVGRIARDFLLAPRLYPALSALLGEEPAGVQTMFYFKPPGARGQALHQDNFYLRVKPGTCLAAWMAVDDVDAENGGMRVVPGSHRGDVACPQQADSAVSFTSDYVPVPDGLCAVHADMKAGDVLFFNGSLIHGSTPNVSLTRFRRSLIAHYVPRQSREMAAYYHALSFGGESVSIAEATGGGPCGVGVPAPGPH